jgi:hypothetical protein
MEQYYKRGTLIEQIGVRVAETKNDTFTMGFLQELFKGVFDGWWESKTDYGASR